MSSKTWSMSSQDIEQDTPVPPLSKCTAIKDFPGIKFVACIVNQLQYNCILWRKYRMQVYMYE